MKKFFLAAALACVTMTATAGAAPRYPAAPATAIPFSWTGFYVGGNIGARSSKVDWATRDFGGTLPSPVDNPANLSDTSARIGGFAGYNWQFAPSALAGLEADIAWGDTSKTHSPFPGVQGLANSSSGHDFVTAKLGWDGTVRGRIGFLANPNWLIYATGGIAWQQIETNSTCDGSASSFCAIAVSSSTSSVRTGWTVGGGVEAALWSNWFGRAEYRYADFGRVSNILPPAPAIGFDADIKVRTNTMLLGIGYKF